MKSHEFKGYIEQAKGSIKEAIGTITGEETLEAEGSIQKTLGKAQANNGDVSENFLYKVVAIYPQFIDVGDALLILKKEGFTDDQISLLGREQAHWQEKLGQQWEEHKAAKGALVGEALGAVPGLVLVTGIALTGGVGLLAVGPMLGAVSALGMGSLAGGLMGAGSHVVKTLSVEQEVTNAISLGHWVIIVHCHTDAEAANAQALLPNRRIVRQSAPEAMTPSDLATSEHADLQKLAVIVEEAFSPIAKLSKLPVEEVMCNVEKIDEAELKQAAEAAIKTIANATALTTTQITDIFRANRFANINIVNRLHEQSGVNRPPL